MHPRYAIEVSIEIRAAGDSIAGRTRDVSRGGLAALVDQPFEMGAEVELAISLVFDEETFSEPLALPARIVWCTPLGEREHQIGTAFRALSAEQSEYLGMFLRYLRDAERGGPRNLSPGAASEPGDPFAT